MIRGLNLPAALFAATGALALDLPATARLTAERVTEQDRYNAPIAPFDGNSIPVQSVDGTVVRRVWEISGVNQTPLQVLRPLRAQFEAAGYVPVLDCTAERCGGFDFRFGTEVLPAPAMFVNLRNYHALTMRKGPADQPEAMASLLVSASANVAHLQIIEARAGDNPGLLPVTVPPVDTPQAETVEPPAPAEPDEPDKDSVGSVPNSLATLGFAVLDGLAFDTGETDLGPGPFPVLVDLAGFMADNPALRIALVGHTDTVGGLESNIAISRARARSVRQRLIDAYGIEPSRLDAEGMGYLAPRTSNLTAEGREGNRRVEAIILNSDSNPKAD